MPAVQAKNAQQFDFYRYLRIIWRRKWLLIIPLAVCVPLAILAAYWYPTEYKAEAVLEMQDNRPLGDIERTRFQVGAAVMSVKAHAMNWNAIREIVLSRKVDFGREIDPDDRRQLERIYHDIQRQTRVDPMGSQHLKVSHTSTSPERNASLVNEIVKMFTNEDRKDAQEKAKTDLKYYRDKQASARTQLSEIDSRLREFAQAQPWLGDSLSELNKEYKDAEDEELLIRRQINGVETALAGTRKELAKEKPETVVTVRVEVSDEVKAARKNAEQAKAYFANVDATYTRAHRKWQEAKANLDAALAKLKKIDKGDAEEIEQTRPNPKYAALQETITTLEQELEKKLNVQKLDANKHVQELYIRLRKAPELLAEKRGLEEQRTTALSTFQEYSTGARAAEKEMQRLLTEAYSSRYKVLEYARDDRKPVQSTPMKIVLLGVLLGLLSGVALVGLIEYLDQTFKTIDDARDYLGLPALGVIPAIFTPRDHRRRLWFRVMAISSVVFVVGVAVTIYFKVDGTRVYLQDAWVKFQEMMQTY